MLGDERARLAFLADDLIVIGPANNHLDLRQLVASRDDEERRVRSARRSAAVSAATGLGNSSYVHWDSSSEPSATEILRRAHDLVAFGWCQGADATDARHQPVQPWSSDACCWSLLGALVAALDAPRDAGTDSPELIAELRIALVAISETITSWSLESWNDDAARTQQDVTGTLAAALSRCATLTGTD